MGRLHKIYHRGKLFSIYFFLAFFFILLSYAFNPQNFQHEINKIPSYSSLINSITSGESNQKLQDPAFFFENIPESQGGPKKIKWLTDFSEKITVQYLIIGSFLGVLAALIYILTALMISIIQKRTLRPKKIISIREVIGRNFFKRDTKVLAEHLSIFSRTMKIKNSDLKAQIALVVGELIKESLRYKLLSHSMERKLSYLCQYYQISSHDLEKETKELLHKNATIRDLMGAVYRPRFKTNSLPLSLDKVPLGISSKEKLVWIFTPMPLIGLLRAGIFKNKKKAIKLAENPSSYWSTDLDTRISIDYDEFIYYGKTKILITDKKIYMCRKNHVEKISLRNIKGISPAKLGVAIISTTRKPLYFQPKDPWFFTNILCNAKNWA